MNIERFNESSINKKKIEIGVYVICDAYDVDNYKFNDFNKLVNTHVGRLMDITNNEKRDDKYVVQFDDIPESLRNGFMLKEYPSAIRFIRDEIIYSSKDKSKLEAVLLVNKFNI